MYAMRDSYTVDNDWSGLMEDIESYVLYTKRKHVRLSASGT
jgi:hypothetical protein